MQTKLRAALFSTCFLVSACLAIPQTIATPSAAARTRSRDVSIDDYRRHLLALSATVEGCAQQRNAKACDPALVGPDDRVPISTGSHAEQRLIRYGWLRVLLSKAADPDEPTNKPETPAARPQPIGTVQENPPTSQLLKHAKERLDSDLAQSRQRPVVVNHSAERAIMEQVLAGPEFRNLRERTVKDSIFERIQNWLNRLFESVAGLRAHAAWIGRVLVWGFILVVCAALAWSLIRLERRWRMRLTPDTELPTPDTPSARDWQLWMEDARRAAASGLWREAIHLMYWAAISRLESRRLWPADRARTPREYLALIASEDPRRAGLLQLTSAFERFWYGGRPADEGDYKRAESIASALLAGSTNPVVAHEGGHQ